MDILEGAVNTPYAREAGITLEVLVNALERDRAKIFAANYRDRLGELMRTTEEESKGGSIRRKPGNGRPSGRTTASTSA